VSVAVIACPDDESEGPSAAPGSPYAALVCVGGDGSFPWVWVAVTAAAALVAVLAVVRDRRPLLWSLVLLVGPAALLAVLQVTVPKDCLSGRTPTGDCARDREQF
jgi:heme exporter protein D